MIAKQFHSHIHAIVGGHDHFPVQLMEENTLIFKAGQNANWLGIIDLRVELDIDGESLAHYTNESSTIANGDTHAAPSSVSTIPGLRDVRVFPSYQMIMNRSYDLDPVLVAINNKYQHLYDVQQAQQEGNLDEIIGIVEKASDATRNDITESRYIPSQPGSLPASFVPDPHSLVTKTNVVRCGPSSFAEMLTDAMHSHYLESGCIGAVINGGFIRGDRTYAEGTQLTVRDIRTELPFPKVIHCTR